LVTAQTILYHFIIINLRLFVISFLVLIFLTTLASILDFLTSTLIWKVNYFNCLIF